jgi:hypothetical protein
MRTTRLLLVSSLVVSLAGCFVRSRPYTTMASETRNCRPSQHWERDRCLDHGPRARPGALGSRRDMNVTRCRLPGSSAVNIVSLV